MDTRSPYNDIEHETGHESRTTPPSMQRTAALLIIVALVIAALHWGRDILLPLALAALLAFLLDPLVIALRRWGFPRGLAVAFVIAGTAAVLGAATLAVGSQVAALGREMPTYHSTGQKKVAELRTAITGRGALDGASRVIGIVEHEIDATRRAIDAAAPKPAARAAAKEPLRVQLDDRPTSSIKALSDWIAPVALPLISAGMALVLLVFILLERNELRDRVLRLAGGDLHRSTDALNEAALRVARYLRMQLMVNVGYGLPLALGLWAIGVPGAWMWGMLAAALRFVPYLGPVIAALFPLAMAFAVDTGWAMFGWSLLLVVGLELISNNLVEPWLFGRSTGVSAVAVLISATFWALVWGPAGLVLATPLTVCAVVLGRHLEPLRFLDLLLGSRPVFDTPTRLYQRLIAGDAEEAVEMALLQASRTSALAFIDETGLPMLRLAESPLQGQASREQLERLERGIDAMLRDLADEHPAPTAPGEAPPRLLCIGGRSPLDTLAARMLAQGLAQAGHAALALPAASISAERIAALSLAAIDTVCLSYLGSAPQAHMRYVCRRLRRKNPALRIVLVPWSARTDLAAVGADDQAGTVAEAIALFGGPAANASEERGNAGKGTAAVLGSLGVCATMSTIDGSVK